MENPQSTNVQQPPVPTIHGAICAIMGEVGGVGKTRTNPQQNYKFRGIADLYLACQPIMAKHGVHVTPVSIRDQQTTIGKTSKGNDSYHVTMKVLFRAYATDASFVEVETMGEAIDSSDKACNKAMSAAMKYALIQLFAIPEEDPEMDTESSSPEQRTGGQPADKPKAPEKKATKTLVDLLAKVGKDKPAAALEWMTQRLGRPINTTKELTADEVARLTADATELAKEVA